MSGGWPECRHAFWFEPQMPQSSVFPWLGPEMWLRHFASYFGGFLPVQCAIRSTKALRWGLSSYMLPAFALPGPFHGA